MPRSWIDADALQGIEGVLPQHGIDIGEQRRDVRLREGCQGSKVAQRLQSCLADLEVLVLGCDLSVLTDIRLPGVMDIGPDTMLMGF